MNTLSARLLLLRNKRKLRQADVADGIGIATYTYQRYEYGEREPSASAVKALADFYGVSADYLLGRSDKRA